MAGQSLATASRLGRGRRCSEDAELIRRLKKTGVVILGSTNAPELGNAVTTESVLHGPCRNPWNLEHSTGGSSGGSAAAVAAGIVPFAQASDGGGSIRIPSHCCGVFGLAPTRGRNPVGAATNGGPYGFGRYHVITRTVRDSAAVLDQLQGTEPGALYRVAPPRRPYLQEVGADPGSLRIAFSATSPTGHPVSQDCKAAVMKAVKQCEELGHSVEEAAPVYDWQEFSSSFADLWSFGGLRLVHRLIELSEGHGGPEDLEATNRALLEHARNVTLRQLGESWAKLHEICRSVDRFMESWDVFITPVCLSPAARLGTLNANQEGLTLLDWFDLNLGRYAAFTPLFNVSGLPCMSVPMHQSTDGLPVGVQCVGRFGDEATLFRLAAQFEQACPWRDRHPSVGLYSPNVPGRR